MIKPQGAFYIYPSMRGLLGAQISGRRIGSSLDLAEVLLDEAKVAVVPGEGFGSEATFRLSYALADDDLEEGISRIAELVRSR